jgi:triosephosphate isomerase
MPAAFFKKSISLSPFFIDRIFKECGVKAWIGHVDPYREGKWTGYISASAAYNMGCTGSLLNHSEHPLPLGTIASSLSLFPKEMQSVVCVKSMGQMERFCKKMTPNYFAYEPPYLIASKTASVASERIEVFEKIVGLGKEKGVKVLAGAGVKDKNDVMAVVKAGGVVGLMRDGMVTGHVRPKQIARLNTTFSRVQTIARTTIIIITPTTAVVILRCAASTFALSPPEVTHSNAPCSKKKSAAMPAIVKKPLIANVSRSEKVGMVKPSKLVCTCRSEQGIGVRVLPLLHQR